MNHYQILDVSKTASFSEIKTAFRKKVKLVHPDLNPDKDKLEFIRLNEAYEVLSDSTTRNLYDLYLDGVPVKTEIEAATPEQRYKEHYKWKKAREERVRMEEQILYTQKFYKNLRYVNVACFFLSLVLTFDFYEVPKEHVFVPSEVKYGVRSTEIYLDNGTNVSSSDEFYSDYIAAENKRVVLFISSHLSVPIKIKMEEKDNSYLIKGSIYVFGNAIAILLFIFSIVVVGNRSYNDTRLTFGVFSVVILIWTLGMVIVYS